MGRPISSQERAAEPAEALVVEARFAVLARAAMAHLNLAMAHPFSDGNGRMARALQTLVLAREQLQLSFS